MNRPPPWRQQRLDQLRRCLDCDDPLPPERRGFYCATHGREGSGPPAPIRTVPCRGCGRLLRGPRSICVSCLGGVA